MTIYIYSGKVQQGKSGKLLKLIRNRKDVAGLLTPEKNGVKMIYHISSRSWHPFQLMEETESSLRIGRFVLSQEGFDKARHIIAETRMGNRRWVIIDEVGHLELKGKGLEPEIGNTIRFFEEKAGERNLVLVVRESLLNKVTEHYHINEVKLFDPDRF